MISSSENFRTIKFEINKSWSFYGVCGGIKSMNGKARAEAALMLEEPDRLPVASFGITPPITAKIIGRTPYYRNTPLCWDAIAEENIDYVNQMVAKDQLDLYNRLEVELIRVSGAFPRGMRVEKAGTNLWKVNGGLRRWVPQTNMDWAVQGRTPPSEEETIEAVKAMVKTSPKPAETSNEGSLYPIKLLAKEIGDRALIFGNADGTFPNRIMLLKWMYTQPDLVKKYIHYHVDLAIEAGKQQVEVGADGLFNGDDYAYKNGPLMSPGFFRRFIFPELKRETDAFKKFGVYTILHCDGDLRPLLDDIATAGVNGVHALDPTAGVEMAAVKEKFGDRVCLVGNVNLHVLDFGSEADTAKETLRCIRDASPGGGHILCTSNVVEVGVRFENFMTMMRTARKYGKYP